MAERIAQAALRPLRPEDLDAVHRMVRRAEDRDKIPILTPREEVEEWRDEPHFDLERDGRVAVLSGEIVAWGRVAHHPGGNRDAVAHVFGGVDPGHRGRGFGSAMLAWQLARARERLLGAPAALPRWARTYAFDFQDDAARLYRRHGLAEVRYHDQLLRDLTSLEPVQGIEGIAIVPWERSHDDAARRVMNASFADTWGSTTRDEATWRHVLESAGSRLDLSFLALAGERAVGACRNGYFPEDEAVSGRRDGWIMQLGVLRSERKRGIASALIAASLVAFGRAGLTHAALGVDTENPSGAHQLYERLGFRPIHRSVVWQRAV